VRSRAEIIIAVALVIASGCTNRTPPDGAGWRARGVDSVVLERTPCFGACPVYRLTLDKNGTLTFKSRSRGDSVSIVDSFPLATLDTIAAHARRLGFATLPDTIQSDRQLCAAYATDHPTLILSIFGSTPKQVVYYTGCYTGSSDNARAPQLQELARLATRIDSMTKADRWIPSSR
jgi:hypothetical protein